MALRIAAYGSSTPIYRTLLAPGLEANDVGLVDLHLGGVLDEDEAVVVGNVGGDGVEQRRLAGARAAADEDVVVPQDGVAGLVEYCLR